MVHMRFPTENPRIRLWGLLPEPRKGSSTKNPRMRLWGIRGLQPKIPIRGFGHENPKRCILKWPNRKKQDVRIYRYIYTTEPPMHRQFPATKREQEEGGRPSQRRGNRRPASERSPRAQNRATWHHRGHPKTSIMSSRVIIPIAPPGLPGVRVTNIRCARPVWK